VGEGGEDQHAFVVAVAPVGDAAVQPAVIGGDAETVLVDLRVEHPFGLAGCCVDGGDLG
jgi:hypothetical protein